MIMVSESKSLVEAIGAQGPSGVPKPMYGYGDLVMLLKRMPGDSGMSIIQDEIKFKLGSYGGVEVLYLVQRLENFLAGVKVYGW
jgi:hypothetical protein